MIGQMTLAVLAGAVTTLSPCVIPVIPLVVGGASHSARFGPLYLLLGLVTSFTLTGTFAAALLFKLGLPPDMLTQGAAVLLILVGAFLFFSFLDNLFKSSTDGLSQWANNFISTHKLSGPLGQFTIGALIGLIWAPCTGPTLGAAISLASQGENLFESFVVMLSFSLGACLPLGVYGSVANLWVKRKGQIIKFGQGLRKAVALLFIFVGVSILLGWHKALETWLLGHLPEWWVNLITRF
ncbi:MAG: cytochrome C biogenesis protein [Bdellovibrionales bacterium CG10_big_fil_rev_8_21_14_0_10_45_34]|nr:MAG: cytochrome C biogenesis protein [Bdellovibrionales bacterium CG10_big_fil_rev_8_21_14_0_10_45_34]